MHDAGVLTIADRAALAAYCQAYARWVEAETRLQETPMLLKTPSGYVQQSPWLAISNKQLEIMGRYMAELGLTPVSRTRLKDLAPTADDQPDKITIEFMTIERDAEGNLFKVPLNSRHDPPQRQTITIGGEEGDT